MWGVSPVPRPRPCVPAVARTSTPHPNRLLLQETRHHRICFLGQSAPSAPPAAEGPDATTPLWTRSGNGQAQGAEAGGEAQRTHKDTQRALCGAAGRLQPRTHTPGRNTGPRNPVAQGSAGGTGWATCPVALGRAHKAASRDSRLALRPLQASPGLSPPRRGERGPDWERSPGWQ